MALKSTIYKAKLNVTDMDRQVYQEFPLTIACHPSETEARMMLRILAFAIHADERWSLVVVSAPIASLICGKSHYPMM